MSKIVNSWTEWEPLERVIVGSPDGTGHPSPEPGHPLPNYGPFPDEMVEAAKEQMAHFVDTLEGEGVTVDRVEMEDFYKNNEVTSTPDWTQLQMYGANNVRDMTMIHGNKIIECASGRRSR